MKIWVVIFAGNDYIYPVAAYKTIDEAIKHLDSLEKKFIEKNENVLRHSKKSLYVNDENYFIEDTILNTPNNQNN